MRQKYNLLRYLPVAIHSVSKNVPLWRATHVNGSWYFFCTNVTDKVSYQKMLYYATSNNLCFSALSDKMRETRKLHFHSNAVLLHCLNSTSCLISWIFFDSPLILMLLYDFLNLVNNAFISGLLGAWLRRKEVKSAAAVGLCCTYNTTVHSLLGFLFCNVMQKHKIGEVGKQSIVWFLTFSVTLLPKIIVIGLCMSRS